MEHAPTIKLLRKCAGEPDAGTRSELLLAALLDFDDQFVWGWLQVLARQGEPEAALSTAARAVLDGAALRDYEPYNVLPGSPVPVSVSGAPLKDASGQALSPGWTGEDLPDGAALSVFQAMHLDADPRRAYEIEQAMAKSTGAEPADFAVVLPLTRLYHHQRGFERAAAQLAEKDWLSAQHCAWGSQALDAMQRRVEAGVPLIGMYVRRTLSCDQKRRLAAELYERSLSGCSTPG